MTLVHSFDTPLSYGRCPLGRTCSEELSCARCLPEVVKSTNVEPLCLNLADMWYTLYVQSGSSITVGELVKKMNDQGLDVYPGRTVAKHGVETPDLFPVDWPLLIIDDLYLFPRLRGGKKKKKGKTVTVKVKPKGKKKKRSKRGVSVNVVSGKGDFFGDFSKKMKTAIGPGIKQGIDFLANRGAGWLSSLIGAGSYRSSHRQVKANSLYNNVAEPPPSVMAGGDHQPFRRREKVLDVWSSNAFQHQQIVFQPGLVASFPWLNICAKAFQRYKIRGAVVEFLHSVEPYGGGNVNGRVVLSTRYDLSANPPSSVNEAENSFFAEPGTPCENILMAIECAPETRPVNVLNVRTGDLPSTANAQFFDHCIIDVCNQGQTDGTIQIGEIWISYDVEMEMPISETITGVDVGGLVAYSSSGTAMTAALPFGAAGVLPYQTAHTPGMSASISASTGVVIDFGDAPVGSRWLVLYTSQIAATGANGYTATGGSFTGVGCAQCATWYNAAGTTKVGNIATVSLAQNQMDQYSVVEITAASAAAAYSNATLGSTTTGTLSLAVSPFDTDILGNERWMRKHHPGLYAAEEALNKRVREIALDLVSRQQTSMILAIPRPLSLMPQCESDDEQKTEDSEVSYVVEKLGGDLPGTAYGTALASMLSNPEARLALQSFVRNYATVNRE